MNIYLIILSIQIDQVFSQWYRGEAIQRNSTSVEIQFNDGDTRKTFSTKSRTECIIECRKQSKESYFVEKEEQCFCLSESEKAGGNKTDSNNYGILYKQATDLESAKIVAVKLLTKQIG